MITKAHAYKLRELIQKAVASLSDDDAFYGIELFDPWRVDFDYKKDVRCRHEGKLYRVLQDHRSQANWPPGTAVSLYVEIDDPAIEWPEWKQPQGAHDAYAKGAKVSHNSKHWISDIDANTYEPGVAGWSEA